MKPISFKEQNRTLAEDQPEYQPLPCYQNDEVTVSCWSLSWAERIKLFFFGKLWIQQLNFGMPLQPQLPQVNSPFEITELQQ